MTFQAVTPDASLLPGAVRAGGAGAPVAVYCPSGALAPPPQPEMRPLTHLKATPSHPCAGRRSEAPVGLDGREACPASHHGCGVHLPQPWSCSFDHVNSGCTVKCWLCSLDDIPTCANGS